MALSIGIVTPVSWYLSFRISVFRPNIWLICRCRCQHLDFAWSNLLSLQVRYVYIWCGGFVLERLTAAMATCIWWTRWMNQNYVKYVSQKRWAKVYIENDSHLKMPHQITMWKLRGYRCSADAQERKKKKNEEDQRKRDRERQRKKRSRN